MMPEKKRKRGRPRVAPALSYGSEQKLRNNTTRTIKKPKYLKDQEDEGNISRGSTPSRSIDSRSSINGTNSQNSRGYNPSVENKDSDYLYGSDFEIEDDDNEKSISQEGVESRSNSELASELELSDVEDIENAGDQGSDFVPFWQLGPAGTLGVVRAQTPIPVWLQDRKYPKLELPKSSDDLLIPKSFVFDAVGIYEVLRHFRQMVRLSPFHFEDFCAALIVDEQSMLLMEIHIALIKALNREEDSQQTHFSSLDQKDSINISLYFVEPLTWAETLRQYLYCDKTFQPILNILNSCNYPYTSLPNRLQVLKFLCDQFLQTQNARDYLTRDGKIRYDDHCRSCHKPGDLLCCDSCCAVYHLDCVNPPITSAPSEIEDWTCVICEAEKLEGVTDCLSFVESSGMVCRQEPLGYDRHGRKYWFLVRRIFVECEDGEIHYYSTVEQVDLLRSILDVEDLEEYLGGSFKELRDDIGKQMEITLKLTNKAKGNKMDVLTLEAAEARVKIEEVPLQEKNVNEEIKTEIKEEGGINEEVGKGVESSTFKLIPASEIKSEEDVKPSIEDLKSSDIEWETKPRKLELDEIALNEMIKTKISEISANANNHSYRLGCEYKYRSYVNQFTTSSLALNKIQHNEERDKKRHLSHKFSINNGSEFKWSGATFGSKENQLSTVRQTLLSVEQNISSHFFNPCWQSLRSKWTKKVSSSASPEEFAKALLFLVACVKPIVFNNVWHDALGHIRLKRITVFDREERKKIDKRERKEADEESKLFPFVKYPIIPKHQMWKTKGEEYRMHGLWGWRWLAAHRNSAQQDMRKMGLRAGPDKICLPIASTRSKGEDLSKNTQPVINTIAVNVESFNVVVEKNESLKFTLLSPNQKQEELERKMKEGYQPPTPQTDFVVSSSQGNRQTLQIAIVKIEDYFLDGRVDVSKSLNTRQRILYPKVAKITTIDSLLSRRCALKIQEERQLDSKKKLLSAGKTMEEETDTNDTSFNTGSIYSEDEDENIEELPDSQRSSSYNLGSTATFFKEIQVHKAKYESLDRMDAFLPCYSVSCRQKGGRACCYSPLCMLKEKTKQKLITSIQNYKIVSSKPPPFDVIGKHDSIVIKDIGGNSPKKKKTKSAPVNEKVQENKDETIIIEDSSSSTEETRTKGLENSSDEKGHKTFSSEDTSGKIYLRKTASTKENNKKSKKGNGFKMPQYTNFKINSKRKLEFRSIFVLVPFEARAMARKGGKYLCSGFNHNAKSNYTWPYPSARPIFRLCWLYRTMTMPTISSVAYQLRILHSCFRWEDMGEKGTPDGRKQVTTDVEIIQTEILKRRFTEKAEYLRRKVTIPLDVPKTVREFTPSQRSGLRKRRRALSPVNMQPESVEEWVEEDKLDLWEIRSFGEKIEKALMLNKKAADRESFTPITRSISPSDFKAKVEEDMKLQRATFNQKKILENQKNSSGVIKVAIGSALKSGGSKIILGGTNIVVGSKLPLNAAGIGKKMVTTKGGRIITVQTSGSGLSQISPSNTPQKFTLGKNTVFPISNLPKVQVTSQGNKVIKLQNLSPGSQRSILPRSSIGNASIIRSNQIVTSSTNPQLQTIRPQNANPIQFVRLADGQVQLKTTQQLIQTSGGKIQILSSKPVGIGTPTSSASTPIQITQQQLKNMTGIKGVQSIAGGQIIKLNGQNLLIRTNPSEANKSADSSLATNITNIKAIKTNEAGAAFNTKSGSSSSPQQAPVIPVVNEKQTSNSLTVRVQVRMTEQGAKTIIQGLEPGTGLGKDHIMAIQHQVRSLLSKCELQVNQLSPLMTITLNMQEPPPTKISPSKFLNAENQQNKIYPQKMAASAQEKSNLNVNTVVLTETQKTPDKKFVVSEDYLQKKTKTVLNNKNDLSPAVEEKFVEMQKLTNENNDEVVTSGTKRRKEMDENEQDKSITKPAKATTKRSRNDSSASKSRSKRDCSLNTTPSPNNKNTEVKRKVVKHQKLETMLSKLKDCLKKDFLKKRALLEKDLKIQIQKDLSVARQQFQALEKLKSTENINASNNVNKRKADSQSGSSLKVGRKSEINSSVNQQPQMALSASNNKTSSAAKSRKSSSKSKNKKIVCICRTQFDDTKFYVGCDLCGNWFHGECVGITEALSRSMTEYTCDECTNAKINKDLYCFCRQPYDESQFYICCERCDDWFHGKCIGIMQAEADDIDDYICPKCDPNNEWNKPCQKKINAKEYIELKKIAKSLTTHKSAWPFLEPVDQSEVPDYYKVVKEPMDLKKIDAKVAAQKYDNLAKFVSDVMLVFDNCRAYNPHNSSFCTCAQTLELFFCQRLKQFKAKIK